MDGQTGTTYTRGFYPHGSPKDPLTQIQLPGYIRNDADLLPKKWSAKESYAITDEGFAAAYAMMNAKTEDWPMYNMYTYNCTDWALDVAEAAGITYAPSGERWWHLGLATPATLGSQLSTKPDNSERSNKPMNTRQYRVE